ncbi:MAG TPA: C2 family cysteine protease, partial [Myxococcota bacterium]
KDGSIAAGLKIPGKAGDQIAVAVSDGTNNTDLKTIATTMTVLGNSSAVDIGDDPLPHKDDVRSDGTSTYPLRRYTGPLFVNGPQSSDVRQGAIGDCYLPAAVAAVAHQMPKVIEDGITEQRNPTTGDREFSVRFYSPSGRMELVTVDADLYTRSWGGPLYGTTPNTNDLDKMELWFPIVEKAYAKWKGSYDRIGNGGSPAAVMTAMTGRPTRYLGTSFTSPDEIFRSVKDAAAAKLPMTAGTHDDKSLYSNTGVYADHAYSVLGAEELNGKKYIHLRNPWGESEAGNDGRNDGYFKLELAQFMKLYDDVSILR